MTARRLACAFDSFASVTTMASVVFSPGWPLLRKASASGGNDDGQPQPPNSLPSSNGAAQKCRLLPRVMLPAAFAATIAPTSRPSQVRAEAEPMPPFRLTVVAPSPAPTLPSAVSSPAFLAAS
jgi:hypothetical protein